MCFKIFFLLYFILPSHDVKDLALINGPLFLIFSYQGHVSAALVLGGVDVTGPHLHTVRFFLLFFLSLPLLILRSEMSNDLCA